MIGPWSGILAVCGVLAMMFGILKLVERLLHPHPELVRKLLHVGMGLVVISFPWVFAERWPVILLAGISAFALACLKLVPRLRDGIGTVLTGVHRTSLGEVCFPAAVASLMVLSRGDKLMYAVPMLIMVLADTVAALVGVAYGKVRYVTSDGFKSAEGSIAFFTIAFLSVHVPLLLFTDVEKSQTLLIAVIIGLLCTMIEAISARGLDNLLIPLGAFGFLRLYIHANQEALLLRLFATVLLLAFALSWRKRSTLDDSALMACALFAFGAWMLGGKIWLIAPIILFLIHVTIWPRFGPCKTYSVFAVGAVTLAGVMWLGLNVAYGGHGRFLFPYAVGFGAHLSIIGISRIPHAQSPRTPRTRMLIALAAGWGLAVLQMLPLPFLLHHALSVPEDLYVIAAAGGATALGALAFYFLLPLLYGERESDTIIHSVRFICALAGSLIAFGLQRMFEMRHVPANVFSILL